MADEHVIVAHSAAMVRAHVDLIEPPFGDCDASDVASGDGND